MTDFYSWRHAVLESDVASTTRLVLMVLGSYMNEIGESCFPSIETLADKTKLSSRAVITHLDIAEKAGFISRQKHGFKGQKWARNEYKATFPTQENTQKAVNDIHHLNEKVVNVVPEGSEPDDKKVVKDVHTNYPYNYPVNQSVVFPTSVEKTTPRESEKNIVEIPPMRPEGLLACRLIKLNVSVTSIHPVLCKWVADNIPIDFIEQCLALARQNKPWPEKIAAGYLDAIIRNELKPKADNSWLMTDEGTIAKGRELRIEARAGESMGEYRQRLRNSLGLGGSKAAA